MKGLIEEINQIPQYSRLCFQRHYENLHAQPLPQDGTLYIGMGSSYYAPLTLYYCGVNIKPEMSSEYYYYRTNCASQISIRSSKEEMLAILISQSGESSETVWNLKSFLHIIAITNEANSTIGKSHKNIKTILMEAGLEKCSSTKTYMNTLLILYMGFGINPERAINFLETEFENLRKEAQEHAKKIFDYCSSRTVKGRIIIGSGPNIGTANQGSLTFSETTRELWSSMSISQFDHGPKECSDNTILIILNAKGKDSKRIDSIKKILQDTGIESNRPLMIELIEDQLGEDLSPIPFNAYLNLIMNYLADLIFQGEEFSYKVGGKVTLVDDSSK